MLDRSEAYSNDPESPMREKPFVERVGLHLTLELVPKAITGVGKELIKSGIFLLAFYKFQARKKDRTRGEETANSSRKKVKT